MTIPPKPPAWHPGIRRDHPLAVGLVGISPTRDGQGDDMNTIDIARLRQKSAEHRVANHNNPAVVEVLVQELDVLLERLEAAETERDKLRAKHADDIDRERDIAREVALIYVRQIKDLEAQVLALKSHLARLITTADGVPVVPGMRLWDIGPDGNPLPMSGLVHPWLVVLGKARGWHGPIDPRECYSTRAAAEAAAKETT